MFGADPFFKQQTVNLQRNDERNETTWLLVGSAGAVHRLCMSNYATPSSHKSSSVMSNWVM